MSNINRVILTGNLTRDPEMRSTQGGMSICSLRIAVNDRRKNGQTGQWDDVANYFDVTVFGAQGENVARYLSRGRGVAIDGKLRWREYTDQNQNKRQAVEVIADSVQFLNSGGEGGGGGQGGGYQQRPQGGGQDGGYGAGQGGGGGGGGGYSGSGVDSSDFAAPAPAAGGGQPPADDDIPF